MVLAEIVSSFSRSVMAMSSHIVHNVNRERTARFRDPVRLNRAPRVQQRRAGRREHPVSVMMEVTAITRRRQVASATMDFLAIIPPAVQCVLLESTAEPSP